MSNPICEILSKSLTKSHINISTLHKVAPVIEWTIKDINKTWKQLIKNCPVEDIDALYKIIGDEYVGNLLVKRFQNTRQGLRHRHDKICELLYCEKSHPIMNKIDKNVSNFIRRHQGQATDLNKTYIIPTASRILLTDKLCTKIIRKLNNPCDILEPKMLELKSKDGLMRLGNLINGMSNIKLRSIILRGIHGDIYCGTRLKKFKMTETDKCPRCKQSESIKHLLLECDYTRKIWDICFKLTSVRCNNLDSVLGLNDYHDKTTLTLHAEVIRRLLSIERPTICPLKLVESVVNRLSIVERGISRYIIKSFKEIINPLTQSTTVLELAPESSSDPDPS